jgi:hypothetical protein
VGGESESASVPTPTRTVPGSIPASSDQTQVGIVMEPSFFVCDFVCERDAPIRKALHFHFPLQDGFLSPRASIPPNSRRIPPSLGR